MKIRTKYVQKCILGAGLVVCLGWGVPDLSQGQETEKSSVKTSGADSALSVKKPGGPIVITGDSFEFNNTQKIVTYTGNVKVVQGETSMFSDQLVIHLEQTGRKVGKAIATGNVRLVSNDLTATGDEGIFYNEEQKLELTNNAKVWQGNNTITAHRVVAFLQEEILEGYGDKTTERAIMTVYSRSTVTPEAGKTPEAGNSAEEQSSPVVIAADTLKLDNPKALATYTGNVIATQESTEIRSDEMNVYIARSEEAGDDIEKIEVFENVQITRDTTTITGEKGVYLNKEQYAKVEGTARKKARAEDKAQNMILEAPIIEFYLETNTITASGTGVKTYFGQEEGESALETGTSTPTPGPKDQSNLKKENLPSATLYPGKKK